MPLAAAASILTMPPAAAPGPAAAAATAANTRVVPPTAAVVALLNPEDVDVYEVSRDSLLAKAFGFMRIQRPAAPNLYEMPRFEVPSHLKR